MKFSFETHKGDEKWPLFVNKQLFWWSASITLDNNNGVLTDIFLTLYFATYLSLAVWLYFYSFYSFENLTHLTTMHAFWFPLMGKIMILLLKGVRHNKF